MKNILIFLGDLINRLCQASLPDPYVRGITLYLVPICLFAFFGWTVKQDNQTNKIGWLVGIWENKTSNGIIYERWIPKNNFELAGKSYKVKENDTIVFETMRLVQEQGALFYIPTVKNQNEGRPVRFSAKTVSQNKVVFENPQHDFPQVISYTRLNTDSLVAEISGVMNGRRRKQTFPMKRVK